MMGEGELWENEEFAIPIFHPLTQLKSHRG